MCGARRLEKTAGGRRSAPLGRPSLMGVVPRAASNPAGALVVVVVVVDRLMDQLLPRRPVCVCVCVCVLVGKKEQTRPLQRVPLSLLIKKKTGTVLPTKQKKIICIFVSNVCFSTNIPRSLLHLFFFPSCISGSQPIRFAIIFSFVCFTLFSVGLSLSTDILPSGNPIKAANDSH